MPSALQRKALSLATASRPGTNHSPHKPVISPKTPRPPPCPSFKTVKVFNSPRNHHPPPSCTQSQQPCPSLRRRLYDLDRRFVSSAPRSCIALLANASSSQQPAPCADARVGPSTDHRSAACRKRLRCYFVYDLDRGFVFIPCTRYDHLAVPYRTSRKPVSHFSQTCTTATRGLPQAAAPCADARVGPSTDHRFAACRKRLRLALTRSHSPPRSCISHHHGPVSHFMQHGMIFTHPVSHCITVLHHLHRRPPQYTCILRRYPTSTLPPHTPSSPISLQPLCQPMVSSATCMVSQHSASSRPVSHFMQLVSHFMQLV